MTKKKKIALITGITGQDGSYLTEFLLKKDYDVYGLIRRASCFNTDRIEHLYQDPHEKSVHLRLVYGDLSDASSLNRVISEVKPDEIYNLGAQSHVRVSFDNPEYTSDVVAIGALRLLEAIRASKKKIKYYQASSSEMFGNASDFPQNEKTAFCPQSPYAAAKVFAYWMTVNYRDAYDLFACNGILFNHESPRRGETFVTRKITKAVARIKLGIQKELFLGNLDAKRDWGFAGDYIEAMWLMLQHKKPEDFVIATGDTHSVKDFLECAFDQVGLNYKKYVKLDKRYLRPTEVNCLIGDSSKAKKALKWKPKVKFHELVKLMVEADLKQVEKELYGLKGKSR